MTVDANLVSPIEPGYDKGISVATPFYVLKACKACCFCGYEQITPKTIIV